MSRDLGRPFVLCFLMISSIVLVDPITEEGLGPKWTLELAQRCLNNHGLKLTKAGERLLKKMCRTENTSLARAQGECCTCS